MLKKNSIALKTLSEEVQFLGILDLGTRWGEWSASRPAVLYTQQRTPSTHCIGGAWAPELVWTQRLEEKCLCRGSNPVIQFVVRHYTELPQLLLS
jgi:hypothetical protein